MPDLQLSFHGKFALKKEDLIKILRAAQDDRGLNVSPDELANITGLNIPKLRIKRWAIRAGLVQGKFLSPAGKIVLEKDPFLNSPVTDWFMHFHLSLGEKGLSQSPGEWGGWTWFVYEFLPKHPTFTKNELLHYAALEFEGTSNKALSENFGYLLNAYTKIEALSGMQYLQLVDKDQYTRENTKIPPPYLMGYCLTLLWQRDFAEATSILTQSLWEQSLGFATVFSLSESQFQTTLNELEYLNILEQRREVPPSQLIRRWLNPLDLLEKAYMV